MLLTTLAIKQSKLKLLYCSYKSSYNQLKPIRPIIFFRSMFKIACQPGINIKLVRPLISNQAYPRGYACVHGGNWKKNALKPSVQDTDITSKHKLIIETQCSSSDCKKVNCADTNVSNQVNPCGRTALQNQSAPGTKQEGFISYIKGNTTKTIPFGFSGKEIDPNITYNGTNVSQYMVEEKSPVPIDSKNLKIDAKVSKYLQEHHDDITK